MRLIDADALREERETAWVSPHPHEEGDKCEVIHVSDLDAAPTVSCGRCSSSEWCEICEAVYRLGTAQARFGNPDYSDFGCPYFQRRTP